MNMVTAKIKKVKIKKAVLFTIVIVTIMMANVAAAKLKITAPGPITLEATGVVTHITDLGIPKITGGTEPYTNDAPAGNDFPVGVTTVTWTTIDSVGNIAVTDTQLVTIKDTTAPSITINGVNPIIINQGDVYTDAGATATDIVDGDITKNILVNNSVNKDVIGTYTVTYDVNDSAGNPAQQKTRIVKVVPVQIKLNITSYSPTPLLIEEPVPSHVRFEVTTNQPANILWRLDGVSTPGGQSVTQDFYDTNIPIIGSHTIIVVAQNGTGSISQTWTLNVKGTFEISASPSSVNIGKPTDVILKVSRICGIEAGDNSSCKGTYIPVAGANIDIAGISGSGVTNDTGLFLATINATTNETINVTASKSGYISSSTEIISEITPVSTPHQSSSGSGGSSSSSSSSGGGGGGVSSPESFSNIIKFERQSMDLVVNKSIKYSFSSPELAIYQVLVVSNASDTDVDMRVEHLKNISDTVDYAPEGTIYANENVWLQSARINYTTVRFRVKNSWFLDNGLTKDSIVLLRYINGWKDLHTNITGSDANYTYFESKALGLSPFAISSIKKDQGTQVSTETSTVPNSASIQDQNTTGAKPNTKNIPGFEIISGIGIISIAYIVRSMRNIRRAKR